MTAEYLTPVRDKAAEVLGSAQLAEEWLARPALALEGCRPIDLLDTPAGFERVMDLLVRLEYGTYT